MDIPDMENNEGKRFHFDNLFWDDPQIYESISLYQIGDLYCKNNYKVDPHKQLCYEISYIVSGKGYYSTDGHTYGVEAGDIYLNIPGEVHEIRADSYEPFRYFYIGFNFKYYPSDQNPLYHIQRMFDHKKCPIVQDKFNIQLPFIGAFGEIAGAKDYSNLMVKTYIHQIIILTYRNFYNDWQKEYKPNNDFSNAENIVYQIINYIDSNLYEIEELPQIAEKLGYSYSYLSHMFSREIGLTIQQYYNQRRFELAIEMLKEGELNITEIAEKLHYQSIHSFSKAFRKAIGVSPIQYQSLYKKDQKNEQT